MNETIVDRHNPTIPKWKAGWVGIKEIDCINTGKTKTARIVLITCRGNGCNIPMRIDFHINKIDRPGTDFNGSAQMMISPMNWTNPCWWFCKECDKEKNNGKNKDKYTMKSKTFSSIAFGKQNQTQ
mgnify:CR=1 FL=1